MKKDEEDLDFNETDTTDVGNIPNFIFEGDENFGIATNNLNFILVNRIPSNKTIKNEDGTTSIETYYRWDNLSYASSLESIINCYIKKKEKRMISKLKNNKGFTELITVRKEINKIIRNSLSPLGINKEMLDVCKLIDSKISLENEIKELANKREEVEKEFEKTMEFIKEKRGIIIKQTEPTKHRIKKEE